jgi:hypothetical protein
MLPSPQLEVLAALLDLASASLLAAAAAAATAAVCAIPLPSA